jgi:hypothetical protein
VGFPDVPAAPASTAMGFASWVSEEPASLGFPVGLAVGFGVTVILGVGAGGFGLGCA